MQVLPSHLVPVSCHLKVSKLRLMFSIRLRSAPPRTGFPGTGDETSGRRADSTSGCLIEEFVVGSCFGAPAYRRIALLVALIKPWFVPVSVGGERIQ